MKKTLLAVSGGIDSMCMADMYSRGGGEFAVAHCNFHLRGEESDGDAALVEKWADEHGVPFFRADFDTEGYAAEHGVSIEMAARELRYAWFAQIAREHGYEALATAHNANDNAETLILNLLRGTGSRGLRGMRGTTGPCRLSPTNCPSDPSHKWAPSSYDAEGGTNLLGTTGTEPRQRPVQLIRPMLGMTREEIERYAAEHGVVYREDRTNAGVQYKRNRIRNAVFPEFAQINPSFVRTLGQDMERFAQVDDIAEDYFREAEEQVKCSPDSISVHKLLCFKHWRYILYRLLEPFGCGSAVIAELSDLVAKASVGEEVTFSGKDFSSTTHIVRTAPGRIVIRKRGAMATGDDSCMIVEGPCRYSFAGATILVEEFEATPGMPLKQPQGVLLCDAGAMPFPFAVRCWREGDWLRPFGMGGKSKKVSDLFSDLKLSRFDKESAVIAVSPTLDKNDTSHVAAVLGYRMDEALRVTKGSINCIRISLL